jgi:hypothetical protein
LFFYIFSFICFNPFYFFKKRTEYCTVTRKFLPLLGDKQVGYAPQLKQLNEPYFITLTAPTVPAKELPERIEQFGKSFRQIVNNYKARKKGMKGFRKAEGTVLPEGLFTIILPKAAFLYIQYFPSHRTG